MFAELPNTITDFQTWDWAKIEPYFKALEARDLTSANVIDWLNDWAKLNFLLGETHSRLYVGTTVDTTDEATEKRYNAYLEDILQPTNVAAQRLKEKLIASGLKPEGYAIELRNMRTEAELFREENVPLFTQESKLGTEYDKIVGAQTVQWEGQERTIAQMRPVYQDGDRSKRERAWRLVSQRQLADRSALNELWQRFLKLRTEIAGNADMPDYRAYRWRNFLRFDYTPDDCARRPPPGPAPVRRCRW